MKDLLDSDDTKETLDLEEGLNRKSTSKTCRFLFVDKRDFSAQG
jgi:hypothetical protein